jgi:Phosphoribosylamine-glycine ligase
MWMETETGNLVNLDLMEKIYISSFNLDGDFQILAEGSKSLTILSRHKSLEEAQKNLLMIRTAARLPIAQCRSERQDE